MRLADSTGITELSPHSRKTGRNVDRARALSSRILRCRSHGVHPSPEGIWTVHQPALAATRLRAPHVYARLVEIVQILAGGGFFYAPTQSDLDNEMLRPYIDKYVRGRPGISAEERIALFKLAWDVTGDSFGSRMAQYVRFYSGDPIRNMAGYYLGYSTKEALFGVVDRALGATGELDVPISAADGRDQGASKAPEPGLLSGAYPTQSMPRPVR